MRSGAELRISVLDVAGAIIGDGMGEDSTR
jgi:hypothetical protein